MFGMSRSSRRLPAFCGNFAIGNGRRNRVRTTAVVLARGCSYATVQPFCRNPRQRTTESMVGNPLTIAAAGVLGKRPRARTVPIHRSPVHGRFVSTQAAPKKDTSDDSTTAPWRIAIVGSGPSGCYTAKYLLMGVSSNKLSKPCSLSIDVIERLPTPYGLVRNGVAPDHPEVKNVQNDFDALFEETAEPSQETNDNHATTTTATTATTSTTTQQTIRFFGNVTVGGSSSDHSKPPSDVALDELRALYDVVVLAYGCESDRELTLPVDVLGEDGTTIREDHPIEESVEASRVQGILSAREFVNWYNGHPEYEWVTSKVKDALGGGGTSQNIVVVGHGNVALDCARILAKTRTSLDPTDLTTRALDVLRPESNESNCNSSSMQRSISVVGRRGHVQAAFTIKEVRELTKLLATDHAQFVVREDELERGEATEASREELKARPRARIHKLLQGHAKQSSDEPKTSSSSASPPSTTVHLRFLTNPIRFRATQSTDSKELKLTSVVCERTQLEGSTPGSQHAKGTGVTETIDADLCLVSIGYKGLPIDDSTRASFDNKRGILQNDHGKVILNDDEAEASENNHTQHLAPLYVSGWLKRGPSGIIGTNIGDAKDTVASILKDLERGAISKQSSPLSATLPPTLEELLRDRKIRFVDWDAYRRIEACESSDHPESNTVGHQKRHSEQPREKIVDRETLLRAAGK